MSFCLPLEQTKKFIQALKDGVIDPAKLSDMSSAERHDFFTKLVGEADAREVNSLFETKLLLKNQQSGLINWAKRVSGITEATRTDIISRIERMDKILTPENEQAFLADLAAKRLGAEVSFTDATKLAELSKKVVEADAKREGKPWLSPESTAYGQRVVDLYKLLADLKNPQEALGFKDTAKFIAKETSDRFKGKTVVGKAVEGVSLIKDIATSAVYKSVQASADLSYSLRQGYKVLVTNPKVWKSNWLKAFESIKAITSKSKMDLVKETWMADIVSHPLYKKAMSGRLALGVAEEFFPTTLAEKIPALGNIFKASNDAFTIFTQGSRLGLFEDMYKTAIENGSVETPQLLHDIAYVANSITGRGSLGKFERISSTINKIAYSGRYISSALDTFTMPFKQSLDPIARDYARKSSVRTIGSIAAVMYATSLFTQVEFNPLSSRFGKAKSPGSKDTWIDLTAGLGSYIHTAASLALFKTKNSKTGLVQPLNARDSNGNLIYGGQTAFDVATNWMVGKLAPAPSALVQIARGQTYTGKKPTPANIAVGLVTPISSGNAWQQMTSGDAAASKLISSVSDILGLNSTNYATMNPNGSLGSGKEATAFKNSVGNAKFAQANQDFDTQYSLWLAKVMQDPRFVQLSTENKQKVITNKKEDIKTRVFAQYGFRYKAQKSAPLPKF